MFVIAHDNPPPEVRQEAPRRVDDDDPSLIMYSLRRPFLHPSCAIHAAEVLACIAVL